MAKVADEDPYRHADLGGSPRRAASFRRDVRGDRGRTLGTCRAPERAVGCAASDARRPPIGKPGAVSTVAVTPGQACAMTSNTSAETNRVGAPGGGPCLARSAAALADSSSS